MSEAETEFDNAEYEQDYEAKKAALERILGPMHDSVYHAIIPYQLGGAVDMYMFTSHIPGTGFATMELIEHDGSGPVPNRIGTYELVGFTKHPYIPCGSDEKPTPFREALGRLTGIFTSTGFYSTEAELNPGDTCEIPDDESTHCVVLANYDPEGTGFIVSGRRHCLLLCMEIFRSEMDYARQAGSDALFAKLKAAGYYPYSDLDRDPVI